MKRGTVIFGRGYINMQYSDIYEIMNKDKQAARFSLDTYRISEIFDKLPYGCSISSLKQWLESKFIFPCAIDSEKFFRHINTITLADKIRTFHCISLNDTFWVRHINDNISWGDVSPFTHNYSKAISVYSLDGLLEQDHNNECYSPVIGTDGSFPHTWVKDKDNNITFIKASSKYTLGGMNSGREPYSEYYASQLCDRLRFNHVRYSIEYHTRQDKKVDTITKCKCFTTEQYGAVTASALRLSSYESIISFCKTLNKKSYDTILDMLLLDCLTLNTDRHLGNIEFIMDNESLSIQEIAPIYDNNYSLLPRFVESMDVFNRGEYKVRDNRSFDELYTLVKTHKDYTEQLENLRNMEFTKPEAVEISDKRLEFLNWFLQTQVEYLLKIK